MAEQKPLTSEEIAVLIAKAAEVDELRKKATLAEEQTQLLQDQIASAAAKGEVAAIPVSGSFKAAWEDPKGKKGSRVVEFCDGHTRLRFKGNVVGSAELIKLANGGKLSKKELEIYPAMTDIEKEEAIEFLTKLAAINYGGLKPEAKKK